MAALGDDEKALYGGGHGVNAIQTSNFKTQWGEKHGGDGGSSFAGEGHGRKKEDVRNGGSTIEGIRIRTGSRLDAIQLLINNEWETSHGGKGGTLQELRFNKDEYITSAEIRSGSEIDRIKFVTNFNNVIEGGGNGGSLAHEPGANNAVLLNIGGRCGSRVDQLSLYWGPAKYRQYTPKWGTKYGGDGGDPFADIGTWGEPKKITGIRMYGGSAIDSIELQINNKWQGKHGGNGGSGDTLILDKDEYINKIELRSGSRIDQLKIVTNKGRSISKGGNGGDPHSEGGDNKRLIDIRGRSGSRIDQIQFLWVDCKQLDQKKAK